MTPWESVSLSQLLAQYQPPQWLLSGLLRRDSPAVILGPSRGLKSSLAVELCGALASGGTFLGQFVAPQNFRVGFVGGVEAREVVTRFARHWSAAADGKLAALEQIVWALDSIDADDPHNLRSLGDWIGRHALEVVVIDAAALTTGHTPKAEATLLRRLVRCCQESDATPIVVSRLRSEPTPRPLDSSDLASAPCGAVAQQWLLLNRRETFRPGDRRHRLWLTQGSSGGPSGRWGVDIDEGWDDATSWNVTLRDREEAEQEVIERASQIQAEHQNRKLRAVLKQVDPQHATKLHIRERTGMSGGKFSAAWERLVDAGEITILRQTDAERNYGEARYRWIDPAEPKNSGRVHHDPIDQVFQTMTIQDLIDEDKPAEPCEANKEASEKFSPPSPLRPPRKSKRKKVKPQKKRW
ncbi:AAA family ATPase [Blastopirellula retiformator]|uniref:AAA family ATPase n=1 Tax=Blastopirellula retiformator TaxID=2527970 RepID=UPI0016455103|nr:AAA family ATPase [Blastopirellula retiformator]